MLRSHLHDRGFLITIFKHRDPDYLFTSLAIKGLYDRTHFIINGTKELFPPVAITKLDPTRVTVEGDLAKRTQLDPATVIIGRPAALYPVRRIGLSKCRTGTDDPVTGRRSVNPYPQLLILFVEGKGEC